MVVGLETESHVYVYGDVDVDEEEGVDENGDCLSFASGDVQINRRFVPWKETPMGAGGFPTVAI